MIVQVVRFKSRLSDSQVLRTYEQRADRYRALPGLLNKYYLKFSETGEHGAVYMWESEEAMREFRSSDLARTIPDAYQVIGAPEVVVGDLVYTLRPESAAASAVSKG
jgi:heme-degrading monooxygenase HmoA